MRRFLITITALTLLLALAGCRGSRGEYTPVVDPELANLSKEDAFQRGEALYEAEKFQRSRKFYTHVYENYPNDPLGRRSLLRVADSYFGQGGVLNLVEAQYKYRDFINRYPGSELADYAMLQIANVSFEQMERPDRDQTKTREAVEKFRDMIAAYPNSTHRPDAEARLQQALDRLAKHEHIVARFYMHRRNYEAAISRLNGIVETFPGYAERDATFYDLGQALELMGRKGEARLYFERVVAEFPESDFATRAKEKLQDLQA